MNNSVYYKATDEDGNSVIKHAWKEHKYLYIKNGKYIYPEDLQKTAYKGPTSAINAQKVQQEKDRTARAYKGPTSAINAQKAQRAQQEKEKNARAYKGPTSAINAQKAQKEKEIQAKARAINARTIAMQKAQKDAVASMNAHLDKAYAITKKHNDQVRKEAAERKERPKKIAKKVIKIAAKDSAAKMAYAKYLANKASKSPTVVSAKNKAKSVASKAEYKVTRAGQKLASDVKKTGAYKSAKKAVNTAKSYNPEYTKTAAKNKAKSVASKAEYKVGRAGQKLENDVKKSGAYKTAKKTYSSAKNTASDAYKTAKKTYNSAKKTASEAYDTAKKTYSTVKKKAKKAKKAYNKYTKNVQNYINWLSK